MCDDFQKALNSNLGRELCEHPEFSKARRPLLMIPQLGNLHHPDFYESGNKFGLPNSTSDKTESLGFRAELFGLPFHQHHDNIWMIKLLRNENIHFYILSILVKVVTAPLFSQKIILDDNFNFFSRTMPNSSSGGSNGY